MGMLPVRYVRNDLRTTHIDPLVGVRAEQVPQMSLSAPMRIEDDAAAAFAEELERLSGKIGRWEPAVKSDVPPKKRRKGPT